MCDWVYETDHKCLTLEVMHEQPNEDAVVHNHGSESMLLV